MSKTIHPSMPALLFAALISIVIMFYATTAFADSVVTNFENPPYTLGNINGQDGWTFTSPTYDVAVADSLGTAGFGLQSMRISNAFTSGSFGDWVFSKPVVDEAGEAIAENGGLSGGTRQNHFEAEFDIASAVPGAQQPGLQISVSPDRGDGARMSYLRFEDQSDGIHAIFFDYRDILPFGTSVGDSANGCGVGDDFFGTDVATMDRSLPHTAKFVMDFVDGPRNDVVKIYIDGVLVHTGTSWEDYFRYCEGNQTRTVDSLIFQARSSAGTAPDTEGKGFLIDNMALSSETPAPTTPRNINASSFLISVTNRGSIDNTTDTNSHTGQNASLGSQGGAGGLGGNVTGGNGSENNGSASAGDGGRGGDGGAGGLVDTGDASAEAGTVNDLNNTDAEVAFECGCDGDINGVTLDVITDNYDPYIGNSITNLTQARGRTGDNRAEGSVGGNAGDGGEVLGGTGSENNGGASAGAGDAGGSSSFGGEVRTGNATSKSAATNLLNASLIRIR